MVTTEELLPSNQNANAGVAVFDVIIILLDPSSSSSPEFWVDRRQAAHASRGIRAKHLVGEAFGGG